MPRYYVNIVGLNSESVLPDCEGTIFQNVEEAKREAIGLAQDIAGHRLPGLTRGLEVVVTDENKNEVLKLPLSDIPACRKRTSLNLRGRIAGLISRFHAPTRALIMIGVLTNGIQGAIITWLIIGHDGKYEVASVAPEDAAVAVRFVSTASIADISMFLHAYGASIVHGPGPGGLYRLRVADTALHQGELTEIARRMTQEKIIAVAAPVH